ncbi:MAG TPA: ROK family transcriptional regulator [Chloroflexota bacterium]|nr:ROK family transcriptional regulator [Chloroflexota bacterium]
MMARLDLSRSEVSVLSAIQAERQVTRAAVASAVGLSTAMTARVVTRLQAAGLIREAGRGVVNGPGRQALLLEIDPSAAYVVGLDVGTDIVHVLLADLQGTAVAYWEVSSSIFSDRARAEIISLLSQLARQAARDAGVDFRAVAAVGIAVTGIIDSDQGECILRSNTPGWEHFLVAESLGAALGRPVLLEETARAKSLAERRLGAAGPDACPVGSFLYVDAGTAIGASLVVGGRPFRGIGGLAGELGHVTVDPGGALCRCGNRGCLQATASARAVLTQAKELLGRGVYSSLAGQDETLTLAELAAAADRGDKLALGVLTEAGERLGIAIAMALNLLGLDLVVMGGALMRSGAVVLEAARRVVRLRVLPVVPRARTLTLAALGSDAAARGMALQAIDWLFEAPNERLMRSASTLDQEIAGQTQSEGAELGEPSTAIPVGSR